LKFGEVAEVEELAQIQEVKQATLEAIPLSEQYFMLMEVKEAKEATLHLVQVEQEEPLQVVISIPLAVLAL
jgi:hypothetical protein